MLTKRQTLIALPILILMLAAFWLLAIFGDFIFGKSLAAVAIFGLGIIGSLTALIFICVSIACSFTTRLIFDARACGLWDKTGNLFYCFLCRELQEETAQPSRQDAVPPHFLHEHSEFQR